VRATREREGGRALLLALRGKDGQFVNNPPPDRILEPGDVMIVVGTEQQLESLRAGAGA
jgi:voltage-gated potassium channel